MMQRTLSPLGISDLVWLNGDATQHLLCPACRETQAAVPRLRVPSLADATPLTLYTCSACRSRFFDPPGIHDFCADSSDAIDPGGFMSAKAYIEVGAGIWEMYWPAAVADLRPQATLLDVGCGFGFTVDAWRRLRGVAVGVEMANYGQMGARELGVNIHSRRLEEIPALEKAKFDVVYASEVIEHVPEPREFARVLAAHVSSTGVLCLTTPDAEFIQPDHHGPSLLAALAPGYHGFLLSAEALEKILRSCGFGHVRVHSLGERLVAWASQRPLDIEVQSMVVREEYLRYLKQVLNDRSTNDSVTDGIAYRLFRDLVLAEDFAGARPVLARLEASLAEKYPQLDLAPEKILERLHTCTTSTQFGALHPHFLPNFCFLRGVFAHLAERDLEKARAYFRASRLATSALVDAWGIHFALEAISFVPDARKFEAICAAMLGDPSVCEQWMVDIDAGGPEASKAFLHQQLSPAQLESAYSEGLAILLAFGRGPALGASLRSGLSYLDRQYPGWHDAAQNLGKGPASASSLEQRMLFFLNLAKATALVDFGQEHQKTLLGRVVELGRQAPTNAALARSIAAEAHRLVTPSGSFGAQWMRLRPGSPR